MEVIAERLHSRWELLRIRLDVAVRVARELPAIVEVDVDVTGVAQARLYQRIGGLVDQRLVDRTAVMVPAVPAHRRGLGEVGLLRRSRAREQQQGGEKRSKECAHA
jgi:hypothetical protein